MCVPKVGALSGGEQGVQPARSAGFGRSFSRLAAGIPNCIVTLERLSRKPVRQASEMHTESGLFLLRRGEFECHLLPSMAGPAAPEPRLLPVYSRVNCRDFPSFLSSCRRRL